MLHENIVWQTGCWLYTPDQICN